MKPSVKRSSKIPKSSQANKPPSPPEQVAATNPEPISELAATDKAESVTPTNPELATTDNAESVTPTNPELATTDDAESATPSYLPRVQPIPPPSESMQYRAIGLIRGQYIPSAEQFTRGILVTEDTLIDAVLLGKVMSLVKNHLNADEKHLFVVYPRTRQQDDNLHVQIVGVWEPETLKSVEESENQVESNQPTTKQGINEAYFSVRGEVIYQSHDEESLIVKIQQAARNESEKGKYFKLKIKGVVAEKAVGHFFDFDIERRGNFLWIQEAKDIAVLRLPKKKPAFKGNKGKKKFPGSKYPTRPGSQKAETATPPPQRKEPLPKPVKRQVAPPESK